MEMPGQAQRIGIKLVIEPYRKKFYSEVQRSGRCVRGGNIPTLLQCENGAESVAFSQAKAIPGADCTESGRDFLSPRMVLAIDQDPVNALAVAGQGQGQRIADLAGK